ncbi:D-aminoacylase [Emcibacter nanhaiensis]|uniref:D-aminoacylase n=2 Tax=Emcibacter nanhaiensis TaxID=1505037 RepID=A0A501PI61_9PROT|nr:D-aminoacylase [Emcibacter nanhaiensis]
MYDIVIRNGRVLDGAGNPWISADVAVRDGRFIRIGQIAGRGAQEIDAAGKYISPGWIDMMDQSGEILLQSGLAENKLLMGVTTAIAGEGGTPVQAKEIEEYFKQLEQSGISLNFGTYYSATQARQAVLGDKNTIPNAEQLAAMTALVRKAMESGALGITTALIYPPANFHSTEELIALSRVAARCGGLYATHMRDESRFLLKAVEEAVEIGEKAGIEVEIFHLKAAYQPHWGQDMEKVGEAISKARSRGIDIAADLYPYPAGGTGFEPTVPPWVFADGPDKAIEMMRDPELRKQMKKELQKGATETWSNLVYAAGGWKNVVLANAQNPKYDRYRFRSIDDIARELKMDPADLAWDIMLEALPDRAMALYYMMDEKDIETALRFPWTSIGSDAGASLAVGEPDVLGMPHPRSYGTFPRIISEYVRKRGVLTLEDAIRKMTSWPAGRMGLQDRGLIREGMRADVVIFDFDQITDQATWKHPTKPPSGISYVLVNGEVVIDHGRHTGAKPGHVIRGPRVCKAVEEVAN